MQTQMEPIPPFWFKQRQARLEPVGENTFKVIAPNQGEAYIHIRLLGDNQRWRAGVRTTADGADLAITEPEFETVGAAWDAAFELYRRAFVV
jgi:hypothetical protein